MSIQIPADAIADAQAGAGDLAPVILAIAYPESGFDGNAIGDGGCSKGWLQFYTCGGLGDGHSDAELFGRVSEARLAADYIRGRLVSNGGDLFDAIAPWSTRNQAMALLPQVEQVVGGNWSANVPSGGGDGSPNVLVPFLIVAGLALVVLR